MQRRGLSSLRLSSAALVALWTASAVGQPVDVRLEVADGGQVETRIVAEAIGARRAATAASAPGGLASGPAETVDISVAAPGNASLALAAGLWRLRAEAAGYWSPPLEIWRADDGQPSAHTLRLWPTGSLAGAVDVSQDMPRPDELTIRFQATPPAAGPPLGRLVCPLQDDRFRCSLPAGVLDLRVRASGFVSHYRWSASLPAGSTLDLGRLELRPGASLVGWVETVDGVSFAERSPQLVLRAAQPPASGADEDPSRRRLLRLTTGATDRGFFHFDGLPPGRYEVFAKLDGYATAQAEIDLYAGAESELREPLLLGPPRTLEVELTPPTGATGRPWHLTLVRWQDRRAVGDVEAVASLDGRWRQEGLPEGDYSLTIADAAGARRLHHRFRIGVEAPRLLLEVPFVRVHGGVRLGDEPLAARVIFGGEFGAVSVPLTANEDGTYAGTLPRAGVWSVTIEATDLPVRRELEVRVDEAEASGEDGARVDFALPDTRIDGRVVDAEGRPVGRAFVFLLPGRGIETIQRPVSADGSFEIRGLPPGRLQIHAEGAGLHSEPVAVELVEGRESPPVLLSLEANLTVAVEVRSASGPIPGARVLAIPIVPNAHAPIVTTGVDGRARLRHLPVSARQVRIAVSAPGFAFRLLRAPVVDRQTIAVEVDQLGGTLGVELEGNDPRAGEHVVFLSRDGARIAWQVLLGLAENSRAATDGGVRTVLPAMEPGRYAACVAAAGEPLDAAVPLRCSEGRLDPLGHLDLRLEIPD